MNKYAMCFNCKLSKTVITIENPGDYYEYELSSLHCLKTHASTSEYSVCKYWKWDRNKGDIINIDEILHPKPYEIKIGTVTPIEN